MDSTRASVVTLMLLVGPVTPGLLAWGEPGDPTPRTGFAESDPASEGGGLFGQSDDVSLPRSEPVTIAAPDLGPTVAPGGGTNPYGIAWGFEPEEVVARAEWFDPLLDTPVFRNHGHTAARPQTWGTTQPGACFGMSMLVLHWYAEVVVPARTGVTSFAFDSRSLRFLLGEDLDRWALPRGPEGRDVEAYRLRRFTEDESRRRHTVDVVARLAELQFLPPADDDVADATIAPMVFDQIMDDLQDPRAGLSKLTWRAVSRAADGSVPAHAVVAYRVERGTATAPEGTRTPSYRVLFYDPNDVYQAEELDDLEGQNSLLYFPAAAPQEGALRDAYEAPESLLRPWLAGRFAYSPSYFARYQRGNIWLQKGTYAFDEHLSAQPARQAYPLEAARALLTLGYDGAAALGEGDYRRFRAEP